MFPPRPDAIYIQLLNLGVRETLLCRVSVVKLVLPCREEQLRFAMVSSFTIVTTASFQEGNDEREESQGDVGGGEGEGGPSQEEGRGGRGGGKGQHKKGTIKLKSAKSLKKKKAN